MIFKERTTRQFFWNSNGNPDARTVARRARDDDFRKRFEANLYRPRIWL